MHSLSGTNGAGPRDYRLKRAINEEIYINEKSKGKYVCVDMPCDLQVAWYMFYTAYVPPSDSPYVYVIGNVLPVVVCIGCSLISDLKVRGVNSVEKEKNRYFTMKSLILAQDER